MMKTKLLQLLPVSTILLAVVVMATGCGRPYGKVVKAGENKLVLADERGLNPKAHDVAPDAKIHLNGAPAALEDLKSGDAVRLTVEQRDGKEVATKIDAKSQEANKPEPQRNPESTPVRPADDKPSSSFGLMPPEDSPQTEDSPQAASTQRAGEPSDAKDEPAEESVEGTITGLGGVENQFIVTDESDAEHAINVNEETTYTLNGQEATFGDLREDQKVMIAAEKDGDSLLAKTVTATGNRLDPAAGQPSSSGSAEPDGLAVLGEQQAAADRAVDDENVRGSIARLDDAQTQIVVKDENGADQTLIVNDETTYTVDGKEAAFGDLKVGHSVTIKAENDGDKHLAKSVTATSA